VRTLAASPSADSRPASVCAYTSTSYSQGNTGTLPTTGPGTSASHGADGSSAPEHTASGRRRSTISRIEGQRSAPPSRSRSAEPYSPGMKMTMFGLIGSGACRWVEYPASKARRINGIHARRRRDAGGFGALTAS